MGSRKHTGVATATAYDQYATAGQVQNGSLIWPVTGITGGSLNAYTLTLVMAPSAYTGGQTFSFKANRSNSGATTLNVNSLGAKAVYYNGAACAGGEIVINRVYTVIYDGTQFHLIGAGGGSGASYGGAKVCMSSAQEIATDTPTPVVFNTELYDDSNYASPSSTALTIPVTGRYRVTAFIYWATAGTDLGEGFAQAAMAVNGTRWYVAAPFSLVTSHFAGSPYYVKPNVNLVWEGKLTQNDLVTIVVTHSNVYGSPRYVYGNGTESDSSWLAIERIK